MRVPIRTQRARQRGKQGIERTGVESQESADDRRAIAAAAIEMRGRQRRARAVRAHVERERQLRRSRREEDVVIRLAAKSGRARHDVRIALRKDDDVACGEVNRPFAGKLAPALAVGHHVKRNQVFCVLEDLADDRVAWWRCRHPRVRRADVEENGAGQPHRPQHIRQGIHGMSSSTQAAIWTNGNVPRTRGHSAPFARSLQWQGC